MRTRIICVGNDLVRDDGVGIRIGEILERLPLPENVQVEIVPQLSFDLLDVVASAGRIVLVDAMRTGRTPGTCISVDGGALEGHSAAGSHTLSLNQLIDLAQRVTPNQSRPSVHIVGIEGRNFSDFGTCLSPEVEAAIPVAVRAVLLAIGADEAVLRAADVACTR